MRWDKIFNSTDTLLNQTTMQWNKRGYFQYKQFQLYFQGWSGKNILRFLRKRFYNEFLCSLSWRTLLAKPFMVKSHFQELSNQQLVANLINDELKVNKLSNSIWEHPFWYLQIEISDFHLCLTRVSLEKRNLSNRIL